MTDEVKLELDENKTGRFYIRDKQEEIGRLEIKIEGNVLDATHTEVSPDHEGQGLAKKLFREMVNYARQNQLKVKAYCPYVQVQFKKSPEEYVDVVSK